MSQTAFASSLEARVVHRFRERLLVVTRGEPLPLGASRAPDGVNFVLICRHATAVNLVLCEPCNANIFAEIPLDPRLNRTGDHWHVRVDELPDEFCYGYRVDGPSGPKHRYDPRNILIDPACRSLSCGRPWGSTGSLPRLSSIKQSTRDWMDDICPRTPLEDTIIYELHVRGYTASLSSGTRSPGTFAALVEKIAYLKDLGITAVEILPIDEFDENDCPFVNPFTGQRNRNFWGYNTIAYAAPKAAYASNPERVAPWEEFRRMVNAFHDAGIEIILDVVFNHTAEGGDGGPTYNFRGLDNSLYYLVDEQGRYLNFTGCGNTVNSNHPVVRSLILACLRNLVAEADVDGFRFDLASVLGRDKFGHVLMEPPIVEMISEDPLLRDTKLIAEPWDAAGLYQVGSFPGGGRWSEWNGKFRDDVRRFWRGEAGQVPLLATRLAGSEDLYRDRGPLHSINMITCHDGFTLNDLVSYNHKRNLANGEGNRDGHDDNCSWNCGFEGPTEDPAVLVLRARQSRNLFATLMVSQGLPMILGGDEFLRTQQGNNNAWCQDNDVSWVDWSRLTLHNDFHRFCKQLIALRMRHPALRRKTFLSPGGSGYPPDVAWHGLQPGEPDWSTRSRELAMALDGRRCDRPGIVDRDLYIAFNAGWQPVVFVIPASPTGRPWRRTVDTSLPSPHDALDLDEGPRIPVLYNYRLEPRSMIILVSEA
jgi:isoamylase